jgi:hypothetical protein
MYDQLRKSIMLIKGFVQFTFISLVAKTGVSNEMRQLLELEINSQVTWVRTDQALEQTQNKFNQKML